MAFTIVRTSSAPPEVVWAVLTDFGSHGRWIPATRMTTDPLPPRIGWHFTGWSGVGRVGFADPMVVTQWDPPRHVRLVKVGRVLSGWADLTVVPYDGGSLVTWAEAVGPAVLRRLARPVADRFGSRMFDKALTGMIADAESRAASS